MSEQVSTFIPVDIGQKKYLFFVVSKNDYSTKIKDELEKQFNAFGEDLGPDAKVVKSYKGSVRSSYEEIRQKSWTEEIRKRIDAEIDPFMLIVNKNFNEFDPEQDSWSVIWFSNFYEKPDSMYKLFGVLANKLRNREDIFEYMESLTRNEKFEMLGKYIKIKPTIYGISIDVNAILSDIAESI